MIRRLLSRFRAWQGLAAWGGFDFSRLTVSLTRCSDPKKGESTGYCDGSRLHVTIGRDPADARATLLHEMAHAAAFAHGHDYGHGTAWRAYYEAAASEVFGLRRVHPFPAELKAEELTAEVARRFRRRLK